jgi:CHAD domain-containing protein
MLDRKMTRMEIEAKFVLPDVESLQRLQAAGSLAGLALASGRVKDLHDTYLDTPKRSILAAGYACRRREQAGGVLVTLKGLGGAQGALHRREEIELELPAGADIHRPGGWPASRLRDKLIELIGEAELTPLFELRQIRAVRLLSLNERLVAELCLDEVHLAAGQGAGEGAHQRDQRYYELEVELSPQGTEEELAAITRCLQDEWGLQPQPVSKFERGLAFVDGEAGGRLLAVGERAVCKRLSVRDDLYGRRARALLALDEGLTQPVAGQRASLSARRVRHWLRVFRAKRLAIFPPHVLAEQGGRERKKRQKEKGRGGGKVEAGEAAAIAQIVEQPAGSIETLTLPKSPGLEADDPMAEAARKTLYYHFLHMAYHEPGTRLGDDIEELHDMRVATRRMRAAFRVFDAYLDPEAVRPFVKRLRRTGRKLGAVRDLDVMHEKTSAYLAALPAERQAELDPLLAAWQIEHDRARQAMLDYLDGRPYQQFKDRFGAFLQTPGAGSLPPFSAEGEPRPYRLRHVAPVALAQRLADVQAYDEWVLGPDVPLGRLHQLRIACKHLRYTLEFFREVLGAEAKMLINELKAAQDHLGDLQDAVVASNLLRDFLTWGRWGPAQDTAEGQPQATIIAPGVATYLAYRQTELQRLIETFPAAWARLQSAEFTRAMAHVADGL